MPGVLRNCNNQQGGIVFEVTGMTGGLGCVVQSLVLAAAADERAPHELDEIIETP
jgi:hypothetical protein